MPRYTALPWRKDPAILARLAKVERAHLRSDPNTTIAVMLGVDEKTVRNDLERIHELWRERVTGDLADMKAQAVAELEDVRRRALAAAEFDEEAERAVLYGDDVEDDQEPGLRRRVYRDQKGSASFRGNKAGSLNAARQATMDKAKILGIVVEKVSPTDADGKTLDLASLVLAARHVSGETQTR